jgi:methyltransferase family protein
MAMHFGELTDMGAVPAPDRLIGLTTGVLVAQALSVAATLGVADHLVSGPRSVDEIADAGDPDGQSLYRVLRALVDVGVFNELDDRRFASTELSDLLRSDAPSSLRAWATMVGAPWHM